MPTYIQVPEAKVIHFKHESASARLTDWQDASATIANVYSKVKGQGHATALLHKILQYAEEQEYCVLYLEANQYGPTNRKALNNDQLIAFYSKFGFKIVPDDSEEPVFMHRLA